MKKAGSQLFHRATRGRKRKKPRIRRFKAFGAARQIRTADLILTKDALYLLSYSSISGPFGTMQPVLTVVFKMATRKGLEPSTSGVTGRRSNQLNYRAIHFYIENGLLRNSHWQGQKESNPRHAVLETAALPAELYPYMVGLHGLEPWTNRL